MANKLLEEIKNLGYDHDTALEILKKAKEAEGSNEKEENEEEEQEEEQESERTSSDEVEEKPVDIDITTLAIDITKRVSESVSKTVNKEIKEQLKKLRGPPPKGKEENESKGNKVPLKKNLFEVMV